MVVKRARALDEAAGSQARMEEAELRLRSLGEVGAELLITTRVWVPISRKR
jgi:hypothetical protein